MNFQELHRAKLHCFNPLGRLRGEVKRRTDALSIFPYKAAIRGLVRAIRIA